MQALRKRKEEWEDYNHDQLLRLARVSAETTRSGLVWAKQITSLLLYVIYLGMKFVSLLLFGTSYGPTIVRVRSPHQRPEQRHEFEKCYHDSIFKSRK